MQASPRLAIALMSALAAPSGCDAAVVAGDVDMREAVAGWYAANHAIAFAETDLLERMDRGYPGDILVRCPAGGRLRLVGKRNDHDDFEIDAMFEDCIDEGVMMGGDMSIIASVELGEGEHGELPEDGGSGSVFVDYEGHLRLDGDIEGDCPIDAQVQAPVLGFDDFTGSDFTVDGSVCGHDAYAVVHGQGHGH